MRPKRVLLIAYAAAILASAAPVLLALQLAQHMALKEASNDALALATRGLKRNEQITDQVYQAIAEMEAGRFSDPCAPEAQAQMRKTVMRQSRLQAVEYVEGNRMRCSSMGVHEGGGMDLGPADFISSAGLAVRTERLLPVDEHSRYRISSSLQSGYTVVVHTDNALDVVDSQANEGAGLISSSRLSPISQAGVWRPDWARRLGHAQSLAFVDGDYLVGLQRSQRYAYFTYAAVPATRLQAAWQKQAQLLIPVGASAGLLAAWVIYWLTQKQMGLPAQLRQALQKRRRRLDGRPRELFLVYQPIVDLRSGRWAGVEALMRWRKPDGEFVNPDLFIAVAERHGLIGQITACVIRTIEEEAAPLFRAQPGFFISINMASSDLQDEALAEQLGNAVQQLGIAPTGLRIEATERTFIDADSAKRGMARLRERGHLIAIDDFGTGYSSLSYLAQLDLDCLKIDKSFVSTIGTGAVTSEAVPHIIELAKSLKLRMVAEGVETEAQAQYLRERGVQYAQGWLFAKAMGMEELLAQLQARAAPA